MNLSLLSSAGAGSSSASASNGFQGLREHADKMMQQQRTDAKHKGEWSSFGKLFCPASC
jgi:hypothetical protein